RDEGGRLRSHRELSLCAGAEFHRVQACPQIDGHAAGGAAKMPEPLLVPGLAGTYAALGPIADTLLRVAAGALLVPHGLRFAFGMFAGTGNPNDTLGKLAAALDTWGYRPGWLWSRLIAFNHLVCGPLLVLGLFTRPAALVATLFLIVACF